MGESRDTVWTCVGADSHSISGSAPILSSYHDRDTLSWCALRVDDLDAQFAIGAELQHERLVGGLSHPEPAPEGDKLVEKAKEGDGLGKVQLDMKQCTTCGAMLPAAMDCAKPQCKKGRL